MNIREIARYIGAILVWEISVLAELAARILVLWFVWPIAATKLGLPTVTLTEVGAIVIILSVLAAIIRSPFGSWWPAPPRRNPFVVGP